MTQHRDIDRIKTDLGNARAQVKRFEADPALAELLARDLVTVSPVSEEEGTQ